MPRQYHFKRHFRPSKFVRAGYGMGEFLTVCKCNKSADHNCKNCKIPDCEQRVDGKKPKTRNDEAIADFQLELNRHIPQIRNEWDETLPKYYCKSWCGALVRNQLQHFNFHTKPNADDEMMREVLTELFGDD